MACECVPVASSWVSAICLVRGELVVLFKDGAAFLYPGLGEGGYLLMKASASKGGFVDGFLKGMPHRRVAPPYGLLGNPAAATANGCCALAPICPVLHATAVVDEGPLDFELRRSGDIWSGSASLSGHRYDFNLECQAGPAWVVYIDKDSAAWLGSTASSNETCEPFLWQLNSPSIIVTE